MSCEEGAMSHEQKLEKTLRWPDGVVLTFGLTAGLFTSIGYTIGALGAWTAIAIWVATCVVALLQNFVYAEMALMFPEKSGGISVYAHEGWRQRFSPAGPIAANGYWMGWSLTLAVVGLTVGSLIQAQFFPGATWTISDGFVDLGLGHFIGAAVIIAVWLVNVVGIKPALWLQYGLSVGLVAILAVFIVVPFIGGDFDGGRLTWGMDGSWDSWKLAIVFFYLAGWTTYGSEIVATFAPEFRDTRRDVPIAMVVGAGVLGVLYLIVPLGVGGTIGEQAIGDNPIAYAVPAFEALIGPAGGLVTVVLCCSLTMIMIAATADGGRALYGIAQDDMTIKQLGHLSPSGQPVRQMTLDLVLNLLVLFLIGSPLAILLASNLGYFVCVVFALSGYVLLRRDRPSWPRPFSLGRLGVPLAAGLCAFNLFVLAIGLTNPGLAGYGGAKEVVIALALFLVGPALFAYRRVVQDHAPLTLREDVQDRSDPEAAAAAAEAAAAPVAVEP
jgi:amino acid transporter